MSLFDTHISSSAIERVTAVLRSGWINEGDVVREFESELTAVLGVRNPVTVNSGTSALHLSLVLAGVGQGDEVILPPQTFVATGLAVLMQRAVPVFADIDPRTGNIAPRSVAEKLTSRTKAIIPVHWGGYPCDLDEINAIAEGSKVAVIEDAAHALGASYKGRPVGGISRFTAFSFQAIKHLTTGDGGMVCCKTDDDAREAVALRWFGIDRSKSKPNVLGARTRDISTVGYKYHMNNIAAALGLGNLEDFPARLARRREIAAFYGRELRGVPGLELLDFQPDREHAYWLFTVLIDGRDNFVRKLADRGISSSVVDLRIDRNSVFGRMCDNLPGQANFEKKQISIPVHEGLSQQDAEQVVRVIRSGW